MEAQSSSPSCCCWQDGLARLQLAPQLSPWLLLLSAHTFLFSVSALMPADGCHISLTMPRVPHPCTAGCPALHGCRGASAGQLTDCIPLYKTRILFFYLHSLDKNTTACPTFAVELPAPPIAHPCRALQKHHCLEQSTSWYPPVVTRGNRS